MFFAVVPAIRWPRKPDPRLRTSFLEFPIPNVDFSVADGVRVRQHKACNPAIFAPSVAKKPHIRLKAEASLNFGGIPHYTLTPPTEIIMTLPS